MSSHVRDKDSIWVSQSNPLLQWIFMLFLGSLGLLFITTLWHAPKDYGSVELTCFIVGWLLCALSILTMTYIERTTITVDIKTGIISVVRKSLSKHSSFDIRFVDIKQMRLVNTESSMLIRYFIELVTQDGMVYTLFDDAFDDILDAKKMSSKLDRLQRIVKSYQY